MRGGDFNLSTPHFLTCNYSDLRSDTESRDLDCIGRQKRQGVQVVTARKDRSALNRSAEQWTAPAGEPDPAGASGRNEVVDTAAHDAQAAQLDCRIATNPGRRGDNPFSVIINEQEEGCG